MTGPEFSRPVVVRQAEGLVQNLVASEAERKALPVPAKAEPAIVQAPAGPARSYPPLEPQ